MKKITLSLIAACSCLSATSQVVLTQNFTSPFNPASNNWVTNNLSTAIGTTPTWFQGNAAVFSAFNGAAPDYYAANFNNVTTGDISNWLITPTVTIYNGAVLEFATRTAAGTPSADRLQIRLSSTGGTTFATGLPTDLGSFTSLIFDINPLLVTTPPTSVNNGVVNGYPQAWTVYQVPVTGVTGTVTGRFAFRYFVTNGGPNGNNSNFIGLDAVKYTLPCGPVVASVVSCAGSPAVLNAIGLSTTTYSWNTGASTSSIGVSPSATTVYTLFPSNGTIACGNSITATVTIGNQLSVNVTASTITSCAGRTVTLTGAGSAAGTYTWSNNAAPLVPIGTGAVITVTPGIGSNSYNVATASSPTCFGSSNFVVTGLVNPIVNITSASTLACVSGPSVAVSFTGSGASTYTFVLGNQAAAGNPISVNIAAQDATTATQYSIVLGVVGTAANGCTASFIYNLTVNRTPTVNVTASKTIECINRTVTLTANSNPGDTYVWSGSTSATGPQVNYSTNTTSGVKNFNVVGTTSLGCVSLPALRTLTVSLCTGIETLGGSSQAAVYPNPFNNEIKVAGIEGRLELFNALGELVMSTFISESATLSTTDLAKGIYILKAYNASNEVEKTIKLLKN